MDVEIEDGYAFEMVLIEGSVRSQRDTVEKTESHGSGFFGVVARRPDGTENAGIRVGEDKVHPLNRGPSGITRRR
tara:strand:+ start:78 stop:302 length:225 start_codon:yes stop_codon:yes gene_type:complete